MTIQFFTKALCWVMLLSVVLPCRAAEVNLMPWPSKLEQRPGFLSLDSPLRYKVIGNDKRLPHAVSHFKEQLSLRTGVAFHGAGVTSSPVLEIRCQSIGPSIQKLGEDESYQLSVVPERVDSPPLTLSGFCVEWKRSCSSFRAGHMDGSSRQ